MKNLKQHVLDWKAETGLGFALYGTPSESLTDRFARLTRQRWGEIEGITDRNYLTNSYHVNVTEPIDAFTKLKFESQFHRISSGGAISYIELPNMSHNVEALVKIIQYMYDNVQYAEVTLNWTIARFAALKVKSSVMTIFNGIVLTAVTETGTR